MLVVLMKRQRVAPDRNDEISVILVKEKLHYFVEQPVYGVDYGFMGKHFFRGWLIANWNWLVVFWEKTRISFISGSSGNNIEIILICDDI